MDTPETMSDTPEDASKLVERCQHEWNDMRSDTDPYRDDECKWCGVAKAEAREEPVGSLVERLRNAPNWLRQEFGSWKDATSFYDRAPFEAAALIERQQAALREKDAEIERLAKYGVDMSAAQGSEQKRREQAESELAAAKRETRAQTIEECAKVCEKYGAEQWDRYKRGDHTNPDSGRADPHTQGLSCGADICADAIRAFAAPSAERES